MCRPSLYKIYWVLGSSRVTTAGIVCSSASVQCSHVYLGICCAAGQADSRNLTPQQSMELLATCDRRLQALMAEADLLGQPVLSGSNSTAEAAFEAELRQAFASILIESGTLHIQLGSLLLDPARR